MIKYILFDLDGTLTDSGTGIINSAIYALGKFGITIKDRKELFPFIGPPLSESFRDLFGIPEEQVPLAIQYYREDYNVKGIYENEVYEGIRETLEELTNLGYKLIIATSKPDYLAEIVLKHFDLIKYFSYISGAVKGVRSTKYEVINHALTYNNISNLDEVIMVGDRKYDVIGANENNIRSIAVLYGGYSTMEEFIEFPPTYFANSPKDIIKIVENINLK